MRFRPAGSVLCVLVAGLLAGCVPTRPTLPPPPAHPKGQTLWHIVNERCVPGQMASGDPAPCTLVSIADGRERGYALLKDLVGAGQFLVMPTILVTGIEDPRLLRRDAPDYFTPAWTARRRVAERFGLALTRDDIGVAVNSRYGRSQDLLHLHVDCLTLEARDALRRAAAHVGGAWSRRPLTIAGHRYYAVRIDGDERVAANPFVLVARGLHVRAGDMGAWTVLLAGAEFSGRPGFILLAARANPAAGDDGSAEVLQDHDCKGRRPVAG